MMARGNKSRYKAPLRLEGRFVSAAAAEVNISSSEAGSTSPIPVNLRKQNSTTPLPKRGQAGVTDEGCLDNWVSAAAVTEESNT